MKKKLIYESPKTKVRALDLENACLQAVSDIVNDNPGNPMPWGA